MSPAARILPILGVLTLLALNLPEYLQVVTGRFPLGSFGDDFHIFYAAAWMVSLGDPRCYDLQVLNRYCLQVTAGQYPAWPLYHFPAFMFLFKPIVLWDFPTATRIFLVLNHLLLVGSVACLTSALGWGRTRAERLAVVASWSVLGLLMAPTIETLNRGQLNILMLFLVCLTLLAAARRSAVASSLFLSLGIVVKTVPLVLVLPLAIRGLHRWWLGALAWFGLLSIAAFLIFPELTVGWWFSRFQDLGSTSWMGNASPECQSWASSLARWFFPRTGNPPPYAPLLWDSPTVGTFAILFMTAMVWAVTFVALFQGRKAPHPTLIDDIALVLCAAGAGIPYNWHHHHTWLLVPVIVFWRRILERRAVLTLPGIALLAATLGLALLDGPIYRGFMTLRLARYHFLLWGGGAFAATTLLAVGVMLRNSGADRPHA